MDVSTRSTVLRSVREEGVSPAVIDFLEDYLRSDPNGEKREFDDSERPQLEARDILDRLRQISQCEEEIKQRQLGLLRDLLRLEESKRFLQHMLRRALGSPPVPSELREQALQEHSAEEVETLVRELQKAGSFSFDDIMAGLEKGAQDRGPTP